MASENVQDANVPNEAAYKEQLDHRAMESRTAAQPKQANTIVDKITEYIPGAAKILGGSGEEKHESKPQPPGPPERPVHDPNIEEFVRDQHRSKTETGPN
ncbi:hypothetical protein S7711_01409 [Stachybotrys chartarum IBT 7711]|uniref:Uncharacterized protein n=1 Tax=Stachybotrys chartarum (strain CBS 109288 / IBT 7711) TaxID=1280523 RepID=A0A084B6W1_STACB|nr:hypothetical protein S7711_01409 [Stachybotrys chartarum IBT 7711]KFA55104.1 hypothetical protein S40293_03569 [Stachybotrys chartarum IBT 40293]KFA77818.1 hypothetical protein S40288_00467 [Stachybotrys chartarum IBT 40288]